MKFSKIKVEQVNIIGEIVNDYGEIYSNRELGDIISNTFSCEVSEKGTAYGFYEGLKYCFCFKNISYLGTPHPLYKKRIQIPKRYLEIYKDNKSKSIETFFVGIYKYKNNIIFVNFDAARYVNNKMHNSSAHVMVIDLVYSTKDGYYLKTDKNKNQIFCFNSNAIDCFFDMFLLRKIDYTPTMFKIFDGFYDRLDKIWKGIDCYKVMIENNYHRKYQAEWPAAYLEYLFEKDLYQGFIDSRFVHYSPDRSKGGKDLDLYFPSLDEYGDLKMHSNNSNGIIGNKTSTIIDCISKGKSLYYIVFNHDTVFDNKCNYEVTFFWNKSLCKSNSYSYSTKMKNHIKLTNYMIIEINQDNSYYLKKDFQNGFVNSDGSIRGSKVAISKRDLVNFVVHEYAK